MNERRKSARLSIKSSTCSTSSLSKASLIECSPTSSSMLSVGNFSSPQTSNSSCKLNKSLSNPNHLPPKQQMKNVVRRSPKVMTNLSMGQADINQISKLTKVKRPVLRNKKNKGTHQKSKNINSNAIKQKKSLCLTKRSKRATNKKSNPSNNSRGLSMPSMISPLNSSINSSETLTLPIITTASTPITSSSLSNLALFATPNLHSNIHSSQNTQTTSLNNNQSPTSNLDALLRNNISLNFDNNVPPTLSLLNETSIPDLKFQLKKATIKFEKACRQLIMLDQHINDLQNSYSNSLENDRKTFKIVYRMQLATLEGTHNAYIEYIERQVEKIKKLKRLLFNENANQHLNASFNNTIATITTIGPLAGTSGTLANTSSNSGSGSV